MALPKYKIGDHEFTIMSGPPEKPVQACEVVERPGVPGAGVYLTGERPRRLTIQTGVDTADKAAALAKLDEYQDSIGKDPVNMVWADQEFDPGRASRVIVLDVRMAGPLMSYPTCVGGINVADGQPCVWLACDWDIISLDAS